MGTLKSTSIQELMDTQESMGTQEVVDIPEPGALNSPCSAPALVLLMPPSPESMPLAAA